MFSYRFDILANVKNIFFKIKKNYFDVFLNKKIFEKATDTTHSNTYLNDFGLDYLIEEMSPTPISEYCFFRRKVNYQVD